MLKEKKNTEIKKRLFLFHSERVGCKGHNVVEGSCDMIKDGFFYILDVKFPK